jgi:hypothetical protein
MLIRYVGRSSEKVVVLITETIKKKITQRFLAVHVRLTFIANFFTVSRSRLENN